MVGYYSNVSHINRIKGMDWLRLAQENDRRSAVVAVTTNLLVTRREENFSNY
jgi:hypothetical protein